MLYYIWAHGNLLLLCTLYLKERAPFSFSLHMFERLFGLSFNLEDTGFLMWEMFEGFEG